MTTKETQRWLNRAWRVENEINSLLELKSETRERLLSVTANLDAVRVSGTLDPHKYDRLVELEGQIDEAIDRQIAIKAEILDAVSRVEDTRLRQVLINRYTRFMTWERIAVDMNYSYMHVCRLHGAALAAVAEKML